MKLLIMAVSVVAALGSARSAYAQKPDAKVLYEANCKACHGASGVPSAAMVKMMKVPKLDGSYFAKHNEDSVKVVLKNGRGKQMKSFTGKLTPAQMDAVADYIQGLAKPSEK